MDSNSSNVEKKAYSTWVLVGDPREEALRPLRGNLNDKADPPSEAYRYRFRLSFSGDVLRLRATEPARKWFFEEAKRRTSLTPPEERDRDARKAPLYGNVSDLLMFSFAAANDIARMWGRKFSYNNGAYFVRPVKLTSSGAYNYRLLSILYGGDQLPWDPDVDAATELAQSDESIDANVWPHLLPVEFTEAGAKARFFIEDPDSSKDVQSLRGIRSISKSLLLPPVRNSSAIPDGSYFAARKVRLRDQLLSRCRVDTDGDNANTCGKYTAGDMPSSVAAIRLVDDLLTRDILLDGGNLRFHGEEGKPLTLNLDFAADYDEIHYYRRRFFLDSGNEWDIGLAELRWIRDVVRRDLINLVNPELELTVGQLPSEPEKWSSSDFASFKSEHSDGTSFAIDRLHEAVSPASTSTLVLENGELKDASLEELVTGRACKRGTRKGGDNDLAERLFVCHAWRHPSGVIMTADASEEAPELQGWREALIELLMTEEVREGVLRSPETRIAAWKRKPRPFRSPPPPTVEISEVTTEKDLWFYRFLFPLGWILRAKTLILDDPGRSCLDRGYVLG